METIKVKARIGDDGILKLTVPTRLSDREVEVVLVVQATEEPVLDAQGWPVGYFDRTYGDVGNKKDGCANNIKGQPISDPLQNLILNFHKSSQIYACVQKTRA